MSDQRGRNMQALNEVYGAELYNFLIIDPDLVNENFVNNYAQARNRAKYAEANLKADLEGNINEEGYLALPTVEQAYKRCNLDWTARGSLQKLGRTPKKGVSNYLDEAAK
ncbi:hypothetical protein KC323_g5283 [Hortaea werneckii]|nr:hypothetical protein KC323_g5283 [Hortaea werneckii]